MGNRLTAVSGGTAATFVYDGDGNRVKATVGGVTTIYIGSYEKSGATIKKYYHAGGTLVGMRQGSTFYWLFGDHLGGLNRVANSTGGALGQLRYKPWGETAILGLKSGLPETRVGRCGGATEQPD